MIPVVIDTSVYISAIVFGGIPRAAVIKIMAPPYQLVVAQSIQSEFVRVLSDKFGWDSARIGAAVNYLWSSARVVTPVELNAVRDPNDNHILGSAVAAGAKYLISSDQDLLVLNPYDQISVLNPSDFLRVGEEIIA